MKNERTPIVYVIGHKTPDTDSVCSAIGHAHFKNITDKRFLFTPMRAGRLNEETRFVLERFGVPFPAEMESLAPTIDDLELSRPVSIHIRDSVQSLALMLRKHGIRSVPVVDDSGRLAGIAGLKNIAQHYMDSVGLTDLSKAHVSLDILVKTLNCRVISNARRIDHLSGRVLIAAMQKGTMLNRLHPGDIVIIGDQHDIQNDLVAAGCSALIITDNMPVSSDIISAAEMHGTLLLSSPHSAFATFQLLTMAVPVEAVMCSTPNTAGLDTHLSHLRKRIPGSEYRSAVVVDSDDRPIGFITMTDLVQPVRKKAILVDHNEISQAVDHIGEAEIIEIIDHHRVGDISTVAPIYVYNDPLGSTCTVVAGTMFLYQIDIPPEIAGILLSGILSDTLMLSLSTTTERDRGIAERLAELAGVSIKDYGKELLHASINIEGKSAAELIAADFKEFVIEDKKFGISQMMVLDCEDIEAMEVELLEELERMREKNRYDLTALLMTNPLNAQHEHVLLKGDTWLVERAYDVKVEGDTCFLPGILSRKKDFIPAIGEALRQSRRSG